MTVVPDCLLAVLVPDDVRRGQRDLGGDPDVGEAVVEEGQVVEHVLARLAAVHVNAQAGGARRELLGQLELGVHRVLSAGRAGQAARGGHGAAGGWLAGGRLARRARRVGTRAGESRCGVLEMPVDGRPSARSGSRATEGVEHR